MKVCKFLVSFLACREHSDQISTLTNTQKHRQESTDISATDVALPAYLAGCVSAVASVLRPHPPSWRFNGQCCYLTTERGCRREGRGGRNKQLLHITLTGRGASLSLSDDTTPTGDIGGDSQDDSRCWSSSSRRDASFSRLATLSLMWVWCWCSSLMNHKHII